MPLTFRPNRCFPVHCAVAYNAGLLLKRPLAWPDPSVIGTTRLLVLALAFLDVVWVRNTLSQIQT